jgi:hypothetical protein
MAGQQVVQCGSRWLRASPAGLVVLAGVATIAGVVGFTLFLALLPPPRPQPLATPGRLVAGDMVVEVRSAAWVAESGPGVRRLQLQAVVSNVGSGSVAVEPRDFSVRGPDGVAWPADERVTPAPGSLRPGQARSIDLLFEIPAEAERLDLAWAHAGQVRFVQVGATPAGT